MEIKGYFIEVDVDSRIVFSCSTRGIEQKDFEDLWRIAGKRFWDRAQEVSKDGGYMRHGQIRMTPLTD